MRKSCSPQVIWFEEDGKGISNNESEKAERMMFKQQIRNIIESWEI